MKNIVETCPCFSGKTYALCCMPFHQGETVKNALLLMRSRFSAYALNLPDYIIETTHPASPQYSDNRFSWKRSIAKFSLQTSFQKLEIHDFKENGVSAIVTFTAGIYQSGQDATFTEKSYFEKRNNRWLYRGGQLTQGHVPNLFTINQLRLLPLAYYGDPILRKKAELVPAITASTRKLVEEMVETMDASDGVGIAAPQVHHSIRLFVIRKPIPIDDNRYDLGEVRIFINPVLSAPDKETWKAPEGCLSIPTLCSLVERPKRITIEYTTLEGKRTQETLSGWEARVVMHECDHLDGILFIDRLDPNELSKLMPFLKNLEERIHDHRAL